MSISNFIIVIITVLLFIGIIFQLIKHHKNESKEYFSYAIKVFDEKILAVKSEISNYKYYTDGHPYVWVETSRDEICKNIKSCCETFGSKTNAGGIGPANIEVRINKEKHAIYVLVTSPGVEIEWPNLLHYEEWLESGRPFAERISEHKKNESGNA